MEINKAIRKAVIESFDPQYLNPLNQVFICDLDEILLLEGWDSSKKSWKIRRVPTEQNGLDKDTVIHASEIGDPYMALRISSLFARERRMFRWETQPMDLGILIPIKERVDSLLGESDS